MREAPLCHRDDLPEPGCREYQWAGEAIFLVRYQHRIYGYINRCPHRGVTLNWQADAFFDPSGQLLQCASHGALFLIESGVCVAGPCQGESLQPLPLRIQEGYVYLSQPLHQHR